MLTITITPMEHQFSCILNNHSQKTIQIFNHYEELLYFINQAIFNEIFIKIE